MGTGCPCPLLCLVAILLLFSNHSKDKLSKPNVKSAVCWAGGGVQESALASQPVAEKKVILNTILKGESKIPIL
jgi:hypothetical protein